MPDFVSSEFLKLVPNAIMATNPCRLQFCTREIVLFRADVLAKMMQGTLYKPSKEDIPEYVSIYLYGDLLVTLPEKRYN